MITAILHPVTYTLASWPLNHQSTAEETHVPHFENPLP